MKNAVFWDVVVFIINRRFGGIVVSIFRVKEISRSRYSAVKVEPTRSSETSPHPRRWYSSVNV
jgi:hypothetical protein